MTNSEVTTRPSTTVSQRQENDDAERRRESREEEFHQKVSSQELRRLSCSESKDCNVTSTTSNSFTNVKTPGQDFTDFIRQRSGSISLGHQEQHGNGNLSEKTRTCSMTDSHAHSEAAINSVILDLDAGVPSCSYDDQSGRTSACDARSRSQSQRANVSWKSSPIIDRFQDETNRKPKKLVKDAKPGNNRPVFLKQRSSTLPSSTSDSQSTPDINDNHKNPKFKKQTSQERIILKRALNPGNQGRPESSASVILNPSNNGNSVINNSDTITSTRSRHLSFSRQAYNLQSFNQEFDRITDKQPNVVSSLLKIVQDPYVSITGKLGSRRNSTSDVNCRPLKDMFNHPGIGSIESTAVDVPLSSAHRDKTRRTTTIGITDGLSKNCSMLLTQQASSFNSSDFDDEGDEDKDIVDGACTCCSPCMCSKKKLKKKLFSTLPILSWISEYNVSRDFFADVISGVTIIVFHVPQSMGYSLIAQVSPVFGLYTAFFPALVYSFMGTSRHCAIGESAIQFS